MVIPGRVQGGVVVLEGNFQLPEGTPVTVSCAESASIGPAKKQRTDIPLVRTGQPGSLHLTGEQIGVILDEEDAAPRR